MNAFEKGSLTRDDFIPYKIVSLWGMLKFLAEPFVVIFFRLGRISEFIASYKRANPGWDNMPLLPQGFSDELITLQETLVELGLPVSARKAKRLLDFIEDSRQEGSETISACKLKENADVLSSTIVDELEGYHMMSIPSNRSQFYENQGMFLGEKVLRQFPELVEDASEAENCFALARYTACVFHLMRLLERVVQRIGRRLKIKELHKKTWGQILGEIRNKLDQLKKDSNNKGKPKKQETRIIMINGWYALLDAICRATRNPTMHPRLTDIKATYTESEAKDVMDRVRSFLADFCDGR